MVIVRRICLIAAAALMASGCGKVQPPQSAMSHIEIGQPSVSRQSASGLIQTNDSNSINMAAETDIAGACLKAWRCAQKGDEKGAMQYLDDVEKRWPNLTTTKSMRAQCLEKLGKKKEAIKYYQQASTQNEYSSINNFKLAEARRTTGDAKGSIEDYRRLLKAAPEFTQGMMGLAKALIATGDKEGARTELTKVLKQDAGTRSEEIRLREEAKKLMLSLDAK